MRYSRVLTVLAVIGVVGLTATLISGGGRPAPKSVPAAVTTPPLQRALQQQLQILSSHRPGRPHAPAIAVPSGGATTCPVASGGCSTNPCVVFVQSGGQPVVAQSIQGIVTVRGFAPIPGGPGSQSCNRRALPRTFRVGSALAQPETLSVGGSAPRSRGGS